MASKLVIVESPAKAKTIGSYLGSDYEVHASIGHIRDLIPNAKGLPLELKKKWWADYGVDVDNQFEPFYEVPSEKEAQVKKLKAAMKGKTTLVLATDEDREGEAISWHLLETLKPGKSITVQRITFHEITKDAILTAMKNPRSVDLDLVEAQETRRILDRLYGYTLSPVLWSRVTKNLSAGRVQSPAVKIIVDREMERKSFRTAVYCDLKAVFSVDKFTFEGQLREINGEKIAQGGDFDPDTGALKEDSSTRLLLLDEANRIAAAARTAKPYIVKEFRQYEQNEKPSAPFMTTTLQQDASTKLGFATDRTMRIAQTLYEGVDIGGEQVGLITYMRTDSLTLSQDAVKRIRDLIQSDFKDCLPKSPQTYTNKVRNAQEAHEAIRPTDAKRRPADVARFLNEDQLKLYTLIWQRTVACQMLPAIMLHSRADIEVIADAQKLNFVSTAKDVQFDGYLRVYREGKEEGEEERLDRLPILKDGQEVALKDLDSVEHATKPPPRYTEATLIKKLEQLGIGRPSTYASIITVILDRGYVKKVRRQLVPTFLAFFAMQVLEGNFAEFLDLGFTARMDEVLDEISDGSADSKKYLNEFFMGERGLKTIVEERKREIPYPVVEIGLHPETQEMIVVRHGKDGAPFLQIGEGEKKRYGNVPEDVAPADLTLETAMELLSKKQDAAESIGTDPNTGRKLLVKFRQGYYLEVERTPEEIEAKAKPTWVSVPPGVDPRTFSQDEIDALCRFPRIIGNHSETKEPIMFRIGKFGPYIECGAETRNVPDWKVGIAMDVPEAEEILKQPKFRAARAAATAPLKEFEVDGVKIRVLSGRFGPYVTDGEVNATLPRGTDPSTLGLEAAQELLQRKRDAGPSVRPTNTKRPAAKKAPAKQTLAKKPGPVKKTATKKASPRKKSA